jgi:hypothetical protein
MSYRYMYLLRNGRMIELPRFIWRHLDRSRRAIYER